MTIFTEASIAIDEAIFCAEQEDRPQAIVTLGTGYSVMPLFEARYQGLRILETVHAVEEAA